MVLNKRLDQYDTESEVLFDHDYVVRFLERHKTFFTPLLFETIQVFIMSHKFRLSIQYLNTPGLNTAKVVDYFTVGLESNSLDIAFYLYQAYEDRINLEPGRVINALITGYQRSNKLLKAKLHMTKTLLPIFTFNGAKSFLNELQNKIDDVSLENNLFSHSGNPLLCMCLLIEFLRLLSQKFFSLNNACRLLIERIMKMSTLYIDAVDDEEFLTMMTLEKDFSGRDLLKIAVQLELLDLI